MNRLVVGGTFGANEGKPSNIISRLAMALGWPTLNGGTLETLQSVDFATLDTLIWMPLVSNEEAKLLPTIKQKNPKLLLISSKRVVEKEYTDFDIVTRLLQSHSNLGIMITLADHGYYKFKLLDPLGNQFCDTAELEVLAKAINDRVDFLQSLQRVPSKSIGEALPVEIEPEFVETVIHLGDIFSQHVNAINPSRFLGNASTRITRCCHGFPAIRKDDTYLVSRRNVDKQNMSAQDFVHICKGEAKVSYYGNVKPSVDSPIQIKLFNYYYNVNYIVHGHVYVDGEVLTTHEKIPCGYIEEFDEIRLLQPDASKSDFCINLKGHGCLILARDMQYLTSVDFKSRPFLET